MLIITFNLEILTKTQNFGILELQEISTDFWLNDIMSLCYALYLYKLHTIIILCNEFEAGERSAPSGWAAWVHSLWTETPKTR